MKEFNIKRINILIGVLFILLVYYFCNIPEIRFAFNCAQNFVTEQKNINLKVDKYSSDLDYKKSILKLANNSSYTLEALTPVVGPYELSALIKNNSNNYTIYDTSKKNIENLRYRATLHMHTTNSDGSMSVKELLDQAQVYGQKFPKNEYMYVAITDHNTVLGDKNVIEVLEKYPNRYNKLKIVLGMEIFTQYNVKKSINEPIQIHVLALAINPYDKYLNKEFYKKDLSDRYNRPFPDRDFVYLVKFMKKFGIVGVAHPARYISNLHEKKYPYIKEMFTIFSNLNEDTVCFAEGYYQSYDKTSTKSDLGKEYSSFLRYIIDVANKNTIYITGSTDTHGKSIFSK